MSHTIKTFAQRSVVVVATALAALALAVPAGAQDLRSPDSRDAAGPVRADLVSPARADLRSPDAVDATQAQDFRSPDASDTARPVVGKVPAPAADPAHGVDWIILAIGSAGALMLLATAAVTTRRRAHATPAH